MQIRYQGQEKFEIKSGQIIIRLAYGVAIDAFTLPGPGEYEKSGVSVVGVPNDSNVIYVIRCEEINLGYLGKLTRPLTPNEIKELGNIDILFLPLGEDGTLPVKKALELVAKIDPRIVIPMLYQDLSDFKKSEGVDDGELDVLKIKSSEMPEEEQKIVILKPR